jgi:hypothetical protein
MHAAPPVRISLAPDARWHGFVALCAGLAAASFSAWIAAALAWPASSVMLVVGLAAVLAMAGAAWALRGGEARGGVLNWDGAVWSWAPGSTQPIVGEPRVAIDLGAWMLLRFAPIAPHARARWLALSRRQAVAVWPLRRAALFAPRPSPEAVPADPA